MHEFGNNIGISGCGQNQFVDERQCIVYNDLLQPSCTDYVVITFQNNAVLKYETVWPCENRAV